MGKTKVRGSSKKQKSESEKNVQRARTIKNKRKVWKKHLEMNPDDKQNKKAIAEKEIKMLNYKGK